MKFIYWFAYFNLDSPSVRYRGMYPLLWFQENLGIGHYLVVPGYSPRRILDFLRAYLSALLFRKRGSLIVVQRVHSSFIYATLLHALVRLRRSGTIYDLDDADYLEHDPRTIYRFARDCERIHAGSVAIRDHLRAFNPNIALVTSPVVDLGIAKQPRSAMFTVGWVGDYGGDHRKGLLAYLFPALKELPFAVELVLIGVRTKNDARSVEQQFAHASHVSLDIVPVTDWGDERWLQGRIAGFDVGIATLLDTPIQRAKSGIKAKQYLNNGVPVLSTDLPENNNVVKHGFNGFLFSNTDELKGLLARLHAMSDGEYHRLSENARASIPQFDHAHYHQQMTGPVQHPGDPALSMDIRSLITQDATAVAVADR